MRLPRAVVPRPHQAVELAPQLRHLLVRGQRRRGLLGRLLAAGGLLVRLPFAQQGRHLVGLQQAGQADEVLFLGRADLRAGAELAAVEEHAVEGGRGLHRLERQLVTQDVGIVLLAVGLFEEGVVESVLRRSLVEHVVALDLHLVGQPHEGGHRGEEDRGGLAALAGPHEAAHGLGEEERGRGGGGVDAHAQAGDVDAFRHHAHGHQPAVLGGRELLDLLGRAGIVGQDDRGALAGDVAQVAGVGPGGLVVGGDHQAAGVGHAPAHLGEAAVGGLHDLADPVALGVERGPPRLGELVLGERRAERRGDLVAGAGAPLHLARVRQEDDRTHDAVVEGGAVAVGVVGDAALEALRVLLVGDERDRVVVGPERRAGQLQPARGGLERLAHAVAPRLGVARVVDLVEDDQGLAVFCARPVQGRVHGDLRVGDRHPDVVARGRALAVLELGVDADAHLPGGVGPLALEVLGGGHDRDRLDHPVGEQLAGDAQGVGRLARARRRHGEEVTRLTPGVEVERLLLPGTQLRGGAPRGPVGIGRRKVGRGEGAHRITSGVGVLRSLTVTQG